jgi:hypothetical protein
LHQHSTQQTSTTVFPGNSSGLERLLDTQARQVPGEIQFGGSYRRKSVLCPAVAGIGALGSHVQITATACLITKIAAQKSIEFYHAALQVSS